MKAALLLLFAASFAHAGIFQPDVRTFSKSGSTGLYGDVTISEGSNVTLTQAGQNITITANSGSPTEAITTKTASYTVTTSDYNILADTTNGSISITAFSASGNSGRVFCVNLIGNNPVTVTASSGINGSTNSTDFVMSKKYSSFCFKTDGSTFYVF